MYSNIHFFQIYNAHNINIMWIVVNLKGGSLVDCGEFERQLIEPPVTYGDTCIRKCHNSPCHVVTGILNWFPMRLNEPQVAFCAGCTEKRILQHRVL